MSTLDATARSTASARRGLGDRQLGRLLRGDLDWVAMKALEKDRNRRYESAGAFAADVGRYLADEPVEARPPSAWYRARKLVRRNRAVVLAAAAVLVALAGGLAGTAAGLVEARQQRAAAERAEAAAKADRDDSRALSDFLLDRFLHPQISLRAVVDRDFGTVGDLDPRSENRESDDRPLSRMLDISEERIYKMFLGRPRAEAAARYAVGVAWRNLGRYADAEPHLRRAAELRERELGPDHPDTLRSLTCLGETLTAGGRGGDAVGVLDRVRAAEERASGTGPYPGTVYLLALAHRAAGDLPAAIRLLEGLRERIKLVSPPALVRDLAAAYRATGRPGDANRLWADVVPAAWTHPGVTSINVLYLTDDWVADLLTDGQPGRAVEVSREYLAAVRSARPDYPAVVTAALEMHGSALLSAGRPAEAEPVIREVMAFYDRRVEQLAAAGRKTEDAEWTRALYRSRLGGAMLGQGRYAEAEPLLVGGYEGMRDQRWLVLPGARDQLWAAADRLAALYTALGRPTEAAKWWAERDEYRRPQTPPPRPVGAR